MLPARHGRLADPAQRRQHDPDRALGGCFQWLRHDALIRRCIVVCMHPGDDGVQLLDLVDRQDPVAHVVEVVIWADDLLDLDQLHRIAVDQQLAPGLPLAGPSKHLRQAVALMPCACLRRRSMATL
ncbi:hypothetical protein D3C72_1969520 [compost metagenome]